MPERERDALGRPLPPGVAGVPGPISRSDRTPAETLSEAQRWFDVGQPFAAHEIFEDAWKAAPAVDRDLWQGLAQMAVALTHALRGNPAGALAVVARARQHLASLPVDSPYDVDVAEILQWTESFQDALVRGAEIPPLPRVRR